MSSPDFTRRFLLSIASLGGIGLLSGKARAHHTETHFDEASKYQLVYQCNKADNEYYGHILFSAGEMLRKYGDDVELVVTTFGPGLHLLGKRPGRPVDPLHQERVNSLASYGVSFHACGNTMTTLGWTEKDLLDVATVVPIGADDLMLLQQRGFAYISW